MEKALGSLSSVPRSVNPLIGGALAQPTNEQILEGVDRTAPQFNLSPHLEEEIKEVHQEYIANRGRSGRKNIFGRARVFEDEPVQQVSVSSEPEPQIQAQAQEQELPAAEQVFEDVELEENKEEYQRFVAGLRNYADRARFMVMPIKEVKQVFNQYKEWKLENKARKTLENMHKETENLDDAQLEEYMQKTRIPKQCKWKVKKNKDGSKEVYVECDFDDKHLIYNLR